MKIELIKVTNDLLQLSLWIKRRLAGAGLFVEFVIGEKRQTALDVRKRVVECFGENV